MGKPTSFILTIILAKSISLFQIARGLLVRNHASALPMIVRVFDLFSEEGDFVEHAAKSLRILADKTGERILAKDHHCVVKVSPIPLDLQH